MLNRLCFRGWKLTIALILTLVIGNTGFAQKGGGKPPKEDPPPEVNLPNYSITILGTLGGGWATTTGLNNLGDVVGQSENQFGGSEPYLYTPADGMFALNSLVDPISGWTIWQANDINDSGVIVGYGYFDSDGDGTPNPPSMAIRFLPDSDGDGFGNVEPLPVPGNSPRATGVNADGDITGRFHDGVLWHAFLWRPESGFQDLGSFNGAQTLATGISNRDAQGDVQIVGRYDWRAFRYTTGVGFEDLGTLKSDDTGSSEARAINAFGDIAGWADADPKKGNDNSFAFLFVDEVGMISLGTLSTGRDWNDSEATSLNDLQEVVGTSLTTSPDMRAFYFNSETGMLDLESLIDNLPAELAGTIVPARINNSGQICGPRVDNFNNISGPAYIISKTP